MPLRKVSDLEKTVAAASRLFRDVCSEEPPYHTAEELWEGLKHGDQSARLLLCFFYVCAEEKGGAAPLKRQSRQRARDGLVF